MPFDPSLPAPNTPLHSAVIRGQFQSLKSLIDAVSGVTSAVVDGVTTLPAGDPAVVDGVTTLPAGDPAAVSASVVGTELHLSFGLPQGNDGAQGATGNNGNDGPQGPQGPSFANAVVDSVTTLNPGEPATVGVIFDGTNVRLTFGIPRGSDGAMGLPGEVSQVDLNNAQLNTLSQTSNNTNGVATLDTPFANDPPTLADMEVLRQKVDELLMALRR